MKVPIASILGGQRTELLNMPWPDYFGFPAMNGTVLIPGATSMLHLKSAWDHPEKDTDAKRYGRMVHALLLEPRAFATRYLPWDGRRSGQEYKDFCDDADEIGAEVVRATGQYSMDMALEAAPVFLANSKVQDIIREGKAEQTVLWPECGVQMKGRLDWVSTSEHVLADLKNTRMQSDGLFGAQFFNLLYDVKLALYQRGLQAVTGERWPVVVLSVESSRPFDVVPYPIPDAILDAGWEKARRIIKQLVKAIETDYWPGKARGEYGALVVPSYAMEEELEEFLE